jgi:hypothetical protein
MKKYILDFKDFINENEGPHKYGCVMAYLNILNWNDILNKIDVNDLVEGSESLEQNPHITILYGLHDNIDHSLVKNFIKSFPVVSVFLNKISLFENDVDVLKFEVQNDLLKELFSKLSKRFPNSNEYPKYIPHCTIAYLKKGTGQKYIGDIQPIKANLDHYVYSLANGEKFKIYV